MEILQANSINLIKMVLLIAKEDGLSDNDFDNIKALAQNKIDYLKNEEIIKELEKKVRKKRKYERS